MSDFHKPLRITRLAVHLLMLVVLTTCVRVGLAEAQTATLTEEEKLEREFTDPLTDFPQLLVRDSYSPANFGTNIQTNQVLVRPIFPRLPQYTLLPFPQLVRPIRWNSPRIRAIPKAPYLATWHENCTFVYF